MNLIKIKRHLPVEKQLQTFLFAGFFVFVSLFFIPDALAATTKYRLVTAGASGEVKVFTNSSGTSFKYDTLAECNEVAATLNQGVSCQEFIDDSPTQNANNDSIGTAIGGAVESVVGAITEPIGNLFVEGVKWVLLGVFRLVVMLMSVASVIFEYILNPKSLNIIQYDAVRVVWMMVRDIFNMFFIMILLFAAFCTVFQVEKWNLKKVWLTVLINALLVNFSFPIARIIIDISNVTMYYFLNNMFSGSGATDGSSIMAAFGATSQLGAIFNPERYADADVTYIIAMIIFAFIFGMTMLVLAIMFLVRTVMLAALVMFSPAGFVPYIFPQTSEWADKWWKQLFNYAFFGPIMVAMMAIALKVMVEAQNQGFMNASGSVMDAARNNVPTTSTSITDPNWIAAASFYAIPIIILWTAMGVAKSFGIAGADKVIGAVKKGGKGLAMMGPGNWAKKNWEGFQKERKARDAEKNKNNLGIRTGRGLNRAQDSVIAAMPVGNKGAKERLNDMDAKRVKENSDKHDMANMTEADLMDLKLHGDKFERAASTAELAGRGKADVDDVLKMKSEFGDGSKVFNQLRNKVKGYDPTAAFATKDSITGKIGFDEERMKEFLMSNQFDGKKVNAKSLANEKFLEMAMDSTIGGLKPEDINDLAKKSTTHANNIKASLNKILVNPGHTVTTNENDRNLHLAYMASTGEVHASLGAPAERSELFKKLDKDNGKNLTDATIAAHGAEIMQHINIGKFKEVASNLKSDAGKQALVNAVKAMPAGNPRRKAFKKQIEKDPILAGMWT